MTNTPIEAKASELLAVEQRHRDAAQSLYQSIRHLERGGGHDGLLSDESGLVQAFARFERDHMAASTNLEGAEKRAREGCFRKKPVVIEAVQYGRRFDWPDWFADAVSANTVVVYGTGKFADPDDACFADIKTLEGTMTANEGDWIVKGVKGELYPCKPDIFAATYDAVAPRHESPLIQRLEAVRTASMSQGLAPRVDYDLIVEAIAALQSVPEVAGEVELPTTGDIVPTADLSAWLAAIVRGDWTWASNSPCKYVTLHIDTRRGAYRIEDRDGNAISFHALLRQSTGSLDLAAQPSIRKQAIEECAVFLHTKAVEAQVKRDTHPARSADWLAWESHRVAAIQYRDAIRSLGSNRGEVGR